MFKGLRHTVRCTKCEEFTIPFQTPELMDVFLDKKELSECCQAEFEYIGLQVYNESILANPEEVAKFSVSTTSKDLIISNPVIVVKKEIEEEILQEQPVISKNKLAIEDLLDFNPRGITNTQMIPAIKQAIMEQSKEKIEILSTTYPDVFEKSLKYLQKQYLNKLKDLG